MSKQSRSLPVVNVFPVGDAVLSHCGASRNEKEEKFKRVMQRLFGSLGTIVHGNEVMEEGDQQMGGGFESGEIPGPRHRPSSSTCKFPELSRQQADIR